MHLVSHSLIIWSSIWAIPDTFFFAGVSPDKAPSGKVGVGVGVKVEYWAYQIICRLIILEPHGGHLPFPESHTKNLSLL